jgi:GNAT superfamily N-acetyltransferase
MAGCFHIVHDRAIELSWLAVAPEYRNRGIGSELILDTLRDFEKEFSVCELKTLAPTHPDAGYTEQEVSEETRLCTIGNY